MSSSTPVSQATASSLHAILAQPTIPSICQDIALMPTILVIDDDPGLCRLLAHSLEYANYTAVTATDGAAGLTLFDQHAIDLVILDLSMPHMDGFSICAAIRARSSVAILILSALTGQDVQARVKRSGADAYLAKPPRLAELHRVVQTLLGLHPACNR